MPSPPTSSHRWRFFRAGGFDQVKLETGADLMNLEHLDQTLWVALACPIAGLEFDPKTAALIDSDRDGRIRAPELIAAIKWAGARLKDPDLLIKGGDCIPLTAIAEGTPEGAEILAAAKHILAQLGRPAAQTISLADATDAVRVCADAPFNGDGVITVESAGEAAGKAVIGEIAACMGTVADRSGKPGIDQAKADGFFAQCAAFEAWQQTAEKEGARILPAGEKTAAAAAAVKAIQGKVDDYFGRCRLATFDARAAGLVNRKEEDYAAIVGRDLSLEVAEVAGFPLAQAGAGRALPLQGAVNPAHAAALAALREEAVRPLLGEKTELTEADWAALRARLAPFAAWQAAQAGGAAGQLGLARVRELLGGSARQEINALLAQDTAMAGRAAAIGEVEQLIRFVRDLHLLCVNFVNFKDLYAGGAPALFQAGVLYLDQRSCHLCLRVEDASRHAAMAGLAGAYLAYADCARKGTGEKMGIVAIFSQGEDENLMVGRNGIFYDRKGRDYDATITKILANPISLREAFWAPYRKLSRLIEEQVTKRASAAESAVNTQLAATAGGAAPSKPKFDPSVIALISVALGSMAAALATFLAYLGGFAAWQLPLVAGGIMLSISAPPVLLAYLKLRKRNLGPILDANGWAINTKARINVPFGTSLTRIAKLPPGSSVDIHDRYAEKSAAWPKVLVVLLVLGWIFAFLYDTGPLNMLTKYWGFRTPVGKPPPWESTNNAASTAKPASSAK